MFFTVISAWSEVPPNARDAAFLLVDNWDDWFSYRTMFTLWVFAEQGGQHRVGSVKIGQKGLLSSRANVPQTPGTRSPNLPKTFDLLNEDFFSLGQDENYYETLNSLSEVQRERIIKGLRDCAFDLAIFDAAQAEDVMTVSLLRSVDASNVRGRLHRLSIG
ncbi:MAG TPA: ATP-binding protein, partial [Pseudolabrys sp.]